MGSYCGVSWLGSHVCQADEIPKSACKDIQILNLENSNLALQINNYYVFFFSFCTSLDKRACCGMHVQQGRLDNAAGFNALYLPVCGVCSGMFHVIFQAYLD